MTIFTLKHPEPEGLSRAYQRLIQKGARPIMGGFVPDTFIHCVVVDDLPSQQDTLVNVEAELERAWNDDPLLSWTDSRPLDAGKIQAWIDRLGSAERATLRRSIDEDDMTIGHLFSTMRHLGLKGVPASTPKGENGMRLEWPDELAVEILDLLPRP